MGPPDPSSISLRAKLFCHSMFGGPLIGPSSRYNTTNFTNKNQGLAVKLVGIWEELEENMKQDFWRAI